jgi:phenylalanyl-tRNA synthetase beta chain
MKLPLSWLRELVAIDASADEIAHRLSMAGLVVESIEHKYASFTGVVTAKVLKVEKHPNADRLSLCEVDAGSRGQFKVVCGAPNVRAGMHAALATVGAKLAAGEKGQPADTAPNFDQVKPLEAAVIRGVESQGMLCSERELGISDEHASGILALDNDAPLGANLDEYLALAETILDVEITANRGDCLSILGLAREIAALFDVKLRAPRLHAARSPAPNNKIDFSVEIEAPDLCPRYAALAMTGVKIGPSPAWIRRRLELCGMRGLNNVVDATNYVMLELGQPLHAFDFTKIAGGKIIVRRAGTDREFVTLDNATRALDQSDLLIADAEKPLAIAGIMGGLNSEVSDATTTLLLESAYFEPVTIARTGRRLGLSSEARYRFERGIDRAGQVSAVIRVAEVIRKIAHGREASTVADLEPRKSEAREIAFELSSIETLLGVAIAPQVVRTRLKAIGAHVTPRGKGVLGVVPPSFRPDITEQADLIEEVSRLNGYDEVRAELPPRVAALMPPNPEREFHQGTREVMLGAGMTEATTIAFIAPADNARFNGIAPAAAPVKVTNPLSAELGELRLSLLPGLIAALRFNLNREADSFHNFEIGKVFQREGDFPVERTELAGVSYGPYALASIGAEPVRAGFYSIKGVLEALFESCGASQDVSYKKIEAASYPFLHPGRSAIITLKDGPIGYAGELHPAEAMRLELRDACAVFELDLANLISYGFAPRKTIELPPRFPAVRRDLALVLDRNFPSDVVIRTIRESGSSLLEAVEIFDVYEGTAVAAGKKSVALACRYRAKDRTLTDEEVNRLHAVLVEQARTRLGAELRQ